MIEKLRDSYFEDKNGDIYGRKPSNEEIVAKINEIIDYLHSPEKSLEHNRPKTLNR